MRELNKKLKKEMSLEIKNIKTLNDLDKYIEGCLNDYKYDLSSQEKTKENIAKLISHFVNIT